jgi:hypothetical protein
LIPLRGPDGDEPFVDELFDALVSLPPAAREQMLDERCAGYPSVASQVRKLLDAVEPPPPAPSPPPEAGATVGRYRLDRALGTGATASVWLAFDTHLRGHTALKLLDPAGPVGHDALGAVLHEARAASAILSDHVVRVKTAGRLEQGLHFVEMELVAEHRPGEDGREVLEIGRTLAEAELGSTREIVRLVAEAARGVDAAHRVGVLHRDLKPNNILVTPVSRRAKVTDFGLAAAELHATPSSAVGATDTVTVAITSERGRIVGTPAYMAPEQAVGEEPTRACDVYALGATLYALLAGEPPYVPGVAHPVPALDVLAQVRAGPPPPLRGVPARLGRIVARAMRRDPSERYATAADLAGDLEAFLADRVSSVDSGRPLLPLALAARRNRRLLQTAAALLFVAAALGAFAAQQTSRLLDLRRATGEAHVQLTATRSLAFAADEATRLAEVARENALAEAAVAEEARRKALRGESDAEAERRRETVLREEAEAARTLAEERTAVAEAARATADSARAAADAAASRAEAAEQRSRVAASRAETARAESEEALRKSELAAVELALRVRELEAAVVRAERDVDATAAERDAIAALLREARDALTRSVAAPDPAPTATIGPASQ